MKNFLIEEHTNYVRKVWKMYLILQNLYLYSLVKELVTLFLHSLQQLRDTLFLAVDNTLCREKIVCIRISFVAAILIQLKYRFKSSYDLDFNNADKFISLYFKVDCSVSVLVFNIARSK